MRVLCLHGLGGTGATMWPLVAALDQAGHTCLAPTLPGHGGDPSDLVGLVWTDWLDAAHEWPADIVVGQSMGAMLALDLAARGGCRAVVAINPLAPDPDAIDGLEWRRSRGHERIDVEPSGVDEIAYDWLPIEALEAMHHGIASIDLAHVVVPTLIVTSAGDEVVDPASSDAVAAVLGVTPVRVVLQRGGHVASLDADRTTLCTAVDTFIRTMA
ncbi:MAG: alpha/beta fold hydrolase [Actinobacteria bacterium]|nr:alpha/beta fold hydrolase [Actinomycetota bacterium]